MASSKPASDTISPAPAASSAAPASGDTLGEFVLLRHLGHGGMAEVWLAEQTSLKRNVALKLLKPELMNDATYVKRFQSEAKAAGGLSHPNIVQVYSIGQALGRHYIATEYVQGSTLKAFLQKRGALDAGTTMHIMRQVASALQAAAERGIVHRDIKPENIMLTRKGEVKVADFGLAQLMGGERLNLTQEGTTMGTPLYMSPEQVNGGKLDQRSDIYSLGVTCYHMLAGETPFKGESAIAVAMQHLQAVPIDLAKRRSDLPPELCEIVHRMLEKDPEKRYSSAQKVLNDLKKVVRSMRETGDADSIEMRIFETPEKAPSLPVRRPWLVLSLMAILAAGASAALGWWQRPPIPVSQGAAVRKEATAKDQFHAALMRVDNEDAFAAVKKYFPTETVWVQMADEQLMLLYLKDAKNPARKKAIENQISALRAHATNRFTMEAAIAEAYALFQTNQPQLARQRLEANGLLALTPDPAIKGSWRTMLQQITDPQQSFRPGPGGNPNGRPPGGPQGGPRGPQSPFESPREPPPGDNPPPPNGDGPPAK